MRIMGLDPSSKIGCVVLSDVGDVAFATVQHFPTDKDRYRRFARYATWVSNMVDAYGVDVVVIEGYSFAGKFNNAFQYELGACLRMQLHKDQTPFIEVPPTSLKKFVSGKGNCKKDLMLLNVYKRWEFDTDDDNEADAYGLAMFGRAIKGFDVGIPAVNLTALEKVTESLTPSVLKLMS